MPQGSYPLFVLYIFGIDSGRPALQPGVARIAMNVGDEENIVGIIKYKLKNSNASVSDLA